MNPVTNNLLSRIACTMITLVPFLLTTPVSGQIANRTVALTNNDDALGPQLGDAISYDSLTLPQLNSSGDLAFGGRIDGPGISDANNLGIWKVTAGNSRAMAMQSATIPVNFGTIAIARTGTDGELGPGLGAGVSFEDFESPFPIALNAAGEILFGAELARDPITAQSPVGIWKTTMGVGPRVIALEGAFEQGGPNAELASSIHYYNQSRRHSSLDT